MTELQDPASAKGPPRTLASLLVVYMTVFLDLLGFGLILPLSAANGQAAAVSLRNAAQMAMNDFGGGQSSIQILVKDDKGTPEGARQAAQEALAAEDAVLCTRVVTHQQRTVGLHRCR